MFAFVGYSSVLNNRPGSKQSSRAPKIQDLVEQCLRTEKKKNGHEWQTFSIFLAEFWQIFGKEEVFGRLM